MKYKTESHDWIEVSGDEATVGIQQNALKKIGQIVHVELPKSDSFKKGDEIAIIESVKAGIDLYSPVSGKVIAVNDSLNENISYLNKDSEGRGWLYKIKLVDLNELSGFKPQ